MLTLCFIPILLLLATAVLIVLATFTFWKLYIHYDLDAGSFLESFQGSNNVLIFSRILCLQHHVILPTDQSIIGLFICPAKLLTRPQIHFLQTVSINQPPNEITVESHLSTYLTFSAASSSLLQSKAATCGGSGRESSAAFSASLDLPRSLACSNGRETRGNRESKVTTFALRLIYHRVLLRELQIFSQAVLKISWAIRRLFVSSLDLETWQKYLVFFVIGKKGE